MLQVVLQVVQKTGLLYFPMHPMSPPLVEHTSNQVQSRSDHYMCKVSADIMLWDLVINRVMTPQGSLFLSLFQTKNSYTSFAMPRFCRNVSAEVRRIFCKDWCTELPVDEGMIRSPLFSWVSHFHSSLHSRDTSHD